MGVVSGISVTQFAAVILFFFLPFINVSCTGVLSTEVTGLQFAAGGTIEFVEPISGQARRETVEREPSATFALAAAGAGALLSLVPGLAARLICAAAGIGGVALLLYLKSIIDDELSRQGQGLIQVSYEFAFWGAVFLFAAAAATNAIASAGGVSSGRALRQSATILLLTFLVTVGAGVAIARMLV